MKAGLDILNTGSGHTAIEFEGDELEIARAERIITDMLKRGYLLFLQDESGKLVRVRQFDAARRRYLIADGPEAAPFVEVSEPPQETEHHSLPDPPSSIVHKRRGRPPKTRAVPMEKVRVVAMGRSAGG
jgi:hypothetical protein